MRLKRVISAALAVSMAVSMMPATAVSAFAEGTSTKTAETTTVTGKNSTESKAETSGYCGAENQEKSVQWAFNKETGVLTISGTGRMADYKYGNTEDTRPWAAFSNVIKEVKIEEGVTGIGGNAFRNLTALTKTNIPASINYLGDYIYRADSELTDVEWAPNFTAPSLKDNDTNGGTYTGTYVPTSMFDFCSKLGDGKELTKWLPSSFTGVGCAAFRGTQFTVDFDNWSNLKYIGARAFEQMPHLESFTLTDGIQIGLRGTDSNAFNGSGLKKLIVNTEEVPRSFANGCTELTDITLGSAVKKIQPFAFQSTAITTLDVPEGISNIGDSAFYACQNFNKLTFRGKVTLGEKVFTACGIKELDILDGAEVICTGGDPFRGSGSDPAVTTINAVELKGALKSGKEDQTDGSLWHDIFSKNAGITTVNVCGQNLQYVRPSVFPSMETLNVTGGDAHIPAENTYAFSGNTTLKHVDIDVDTYTEDEYEDKDGKQAVVASFRNAQALETFAVRANNVKLGNRTFCECANLKKIDFTGCDEIHYMNGCLGSSTSGQPLNPNVCIYVNDESANPRATNNDSGLGKNVGIVFVVDGGIVDMNKTGFDSVTKAGCTAKWYEDAKCQTETEDTTPVTGKTYYAKWAKNNYTVTFNNNGHDEKPADKTVEYGDSVTGLPELSDSTNEWVFDGWYMDENFKTKYDNQAITDNTTLYAKWHEYKSADLTVTVANSEYLVNEPVEVNVAAALGDDSSKVAKIMLEYDDNDVTSVKLGDIPLNKKEFTSKEIYQLLKQVGSKDDAKLTVTYSKPGKHTFSVALVDKDGKNVCEAGTDITVVQALMDTTVTEDGEQKETYQANKPITVEMNVTADKETFKQNTLYLTYGDEVEKVELNGHKLTEKQYKISDLLDMMETSPVAAYALRSEADALSIPFEVTFKDAGSYNFEMLVKDAQDQLVCRSIVPIKVEAEKKPDDTKPATYTLSILGGTVKVNGKETAVDEHGDIAIAKDAKVEVTFDKGILSDAQTFDQWIIKPNSVLNAVDPKSETIIFTMPDEKVTIEAMTKDASIEDEPNILGTAAVVGTAAAGTAILAWQGYQLGTELYLKTALPAGTAIPTNRAELALLVWNHAGKPAPAAVLPADATDTQKAIAWAVENDLLKAAKDSGETYVDTDSVSRVEVIRVWNKAQEK